MKRSILHMNPLQLSLLVAIPFVLVFGLINFSQGWNHLGQLELIMSVSLLVLYLWTRKVDVSFWQQNLFIAHAAILFALLFFQGGFGGIGFIWSFGFPFIACLSSNSRVGFTWIALYALCIAISAPLFTDMSGQKMAYIGLAYISFSLIAAYTVAWREQLDVKHQHLILDTSSRLKDEEHALSAYKLSHRTLLDTLPQPLAVHCQDKWVYCNPAAADFFGVACCEAMIGTSVFDYMLAENKEKFQACMKEMLTSGRPDPISNTVWTRKDTEVITDHLQTYPLMYDGAVAFILTTKAPSEANTKQQLRLEHSQRLESLGVLAGGIAHDFNNLLTAISGNAELARGHITTNPPANTHIENIIDACDHASELCKQMLAYAGKGSYEVNVIDLNNMITSMGKLIRASVSSHIALKIKLSPDMPGIEGDVAQIQQLILNFIVNSADAIGSDSGEIKVSSGVRQVKQKTLDKMYNGSNIKAGQYIVIEVKDTGSGMSSETMMKIFDPFFSTKKTGSGLGLSAVLGIVRGHHGAIQVHSEIGAGTAFRVYLPSTEQAFKEKTLSTVEIDAWNGDGKILIVDDDMRVRNVAQAFVKSMHFDVISGEDGREGLELFHQHHEQLSAVLLDMTMPILGGVEAMAGMRDINSSVPIVLVSGYSEVEAGVLITGDRPNAFLQKPFKATEMKKVLFEVLHRPA